MTDTLRTLSVVVPVYNSEATLGPLVDRTLSVLSDHFEAVEMVLVNDGSVDESDAVARAAVQRHPGRVRYVKLARNFGEHNAVMCGLRHATGDCVAIIDDDFQNPPEEIISLTDKLARGYDVVYSYYDEKKHSWFRNFGSSFNDRVATWMLGKPPSLYLSSFKAMNRFIVEAVTRYDGPFPYIDGLILRSTASIGTQLCRHESRTAGKSNYTLWRLIKLWLNMFTGYSILPLRVAAGVGFAMSATAFLLAIFFVVSWSLGGIFSDQPIEPGWASIIVSVTFLAGVQLMVLGVVGEYLGRLFLTANRSPQFVVREVVAEVAEASSIRTAAIGQDPPRAHLEETISAGAPQLAASGGPT